MRYVIVQPFGGETTTGGGPYLEWLGEHAHELPPGVRVFALDPEHHDFLHQWFPRNASLDRISTRFTDDGVEVTLALAAPLPN